MEYIIIPVFMTAGGLYLVYRGKRAIATRYMANSWGSRLFTGISGVEGSWAVAAGWWFLISGYISIGLGFVSAIGLCILYVMWLLSSTPSVSSSPTQKGTGFSIAESVDAVQKQRTIEREPPKADFEELSKKNHEEFLKAQQKIDEDAAAINKDIERMTSDLSTMVPGFPAMAREANSIDDPLAAPSSDNVQSLQSSASESDTIASLPGFSDNNDSETGIASSSEVTIPSPEKPLPKLSFAVDRVQRSNWIGSPFADMSIDDEITEDRFLVGLIVGQGIEFNGAVQSIQGVYQKGDQYVRGNRIGQPGGKESLILVPPGHVVVGIQGMKGTQVNAIQLMSAQIGSDGKVVRSTQQSTRSVGIEFGATATIDTNGIPVVGVFGSTSGTSLTAIGLFAARATPSSKSSPRKWTSLNGKSVVAEMVEATDTTVLLRKLDGKEVNVKLKDLSEDDQEWVSKNR